MKKSFLLLACTETDARMCNPCVVLELGTVLLVTKGPDDVPAPTDEQMLELEMMQVLQVLLYKKANLSVCHPFRKALCVCVLT